MEFILYLLPHSPSFHLKGHLEAMIDCFFNPLHYSCLENPMDGSLVGYSPWGRKESYMTE